LFVCQFIAHEIQAGAFAVFFDGVFKHLHHGGLRNIRIPFDIDGIFARPGLLGFFAVIVGGIGGGIGFGLCAHMYGLTIFKVLNKIRPTRLICPVKCGAIDRRRHTPFKTPFMIIGSDLIAPKLSVRIRQVKGRWGLCA
jgi:hypothetical protein